MLCLQYYALLRSLLFIVYRGGFVVKYLLVAEFQFLLIWQKQVDTEEEEEKEDSPATKDTVSSDFTFKFTFTANNKRQIQVENFSE